jgi:hypothetical protein
VWSLGKSGASARAQAKRGNRSKVCYAAKLITICSKEANIMSTQTLAITSFIYVFLLLSVSGFLLPPIRHLFKATEEEEQERKRRNKETMKKNCVVLDNLGAFYQKCLFILVIFRFILLFFLPIWLAAKLLGLEFASNQLLTLTVMGGSIVAFLALEFPNVMKAHLRVTLVAKVVDEKDFKKDQEVLDSFRSSEIWLEKGKLTLVAVAVYNLGFSTYKAPAVLIYFGKGFEIVPCDDKFEKRYEGVDFHKKFSIQKRHGGAAFSPDDIRFHSFPPQEVLVFQIFVRLIGDTDRSYVTVQFSSEGSWGMTTIKRPFKIGNQQNTKQSVISRIRSKVDELRSYGDW